MIQLADAVPAWCADANPIEVTEVVVADNDHSVRVALLGCSNYSRTGLRAQPVAFDDVPSFDGRAGKPTFAGVGVTVLASTRHPKLAITAAAMLAGAEAQVGLNAFGGGEPGNLRAWRNDQATATTRGLFRNTLRSLDRIELQPTGHPPSSRRPSDLFRGVRAGVHPSERRTHGDEGRHCAAYETGTSRSHIVALRDHGKRPKSPGLAEEQAEVLNPSGEVVIVFVHVYPVNRRPRSVS